MSIYNVKMKLICIKDGAEVFINPHTVRCPYFGCDIVLMPGLATPYV